MAALQQFVAAAFADIPAEADQLVEEVLSVADAVLDQRAFHVMHRAVMSRIQPVDVIARDRSLPQWLLDAVGTRSESALRTADALMSEIAAATFEWMATLAAQSIAARAGATASMELLAKDDPLWYLADRRIPIPLREAILARQRVEVLSVAVLATAEFPLADLVLDAVFDALIAQAKLWLSFQTSLPGVAPRDGIEPLDHRAVESEHQAVTTGLERMADERRMRNSN